MKECPDSALLSAFFDGELESEEHSEIQDHIAECRSCAQALLELGRLHEVLLDIPADSNAARRVRRRIREETRKGSPGFRIPRAVAAAVLFALALSVAMNVYFGLGANAVDRPSPEASAEPVISISLLSDTDGAPTILVEADRSLRLLKNPAFHVSDPSPGQGVDRTGGQ